MAACFTTIGHSTRAMAEFIDMLRAADVRLLVDVRSYPRSRTNPAYNADRLQPVLADVQIGYRHCVALGGRRGRQKGVDEQVNAGWRVQSFHNYADYALGDAFGAAFDALVRLGAEQRLALMCAEAVWWRCHRRIITDYLLLNGHAVDHLLTPGRTEQAHPTEGVQRRPDGKLVYPPAEPRLPLG